MKAFLGALSVANQSKMRLLISLAIAVGFGFMIFGSMPLQAQEPGYHYTVQRGDTWTSVAQQVGLTVEELQAANPQSVRSTGWLIVGEKLFIPTERPVGEEDQFYTVQRGDSWSTIAKEYGIPMRLLQAANPRAIRPGLILYVGEKLLIPPQASAPVNRPLSSPPAPETPTTTPTQPPTTPTPEVQIEATSAPAAVEATAALTATTTPETTPSPCASSLSEYPAIFRTILNEAASSQGSESVLAAALLQFMQECNILGETEPIVQDLTGDNLVDVVIAYQDNREDSVFQQGDLLIFNGIEGGFILRYRARAAGKVKLLAAEDINDDGQTDVVWVDTTCGANTCFDTVYVRSWMNTSWQDWTEGTITMAYAEISLEDTDERGTGQELILTGGVYGSAGAGPQRSRTEIWGSVDGKPYALLSESFGASNCLYHLVIDANRAFTKDLDFEAALSLYEEAITNQDLVACWVRHNELDELRSFSLFRLALLGGYMGDPDLAQALIDQLAATYPDQVYAEVGKMWLDEYLAQGNPVRACEKVNRFAADNPRVIEVLADYGYANPTFEANDVCPVLDVEVPTFQPTATPTPAPSASAGETPASEPTTEPTVEPQTSAPEVPAAAQPVASEDLPECPATLLEYKDTLPGVLNVAQGDLLVIETWLRVCGAMTDDRGALLTFDLNGDKLNDLLLFPTVISDVGYGPAGAEGALFIFHQTQDGTYSLAMAPEIYGQPKPLAVEDANNDGRAELIWTVESCSTFCVTSVQAVTWNGETYVEAIQPGAAIAEGEVFIEPVPGTARGRGLQLRMVGGVSGTPGGGLAVPHTEVWQSINGAPFQRISWTYDRTVEGNDCLGLRLVEADVAMQAANVLGYTPAIDLYKSALEDSQLQACSLFGVAEEEEIQLLQGLASFRLIQALALSGDRDGAQATLTALVSGLPDSQYTEAARKWWESYAADGDPSAACEGVQSIFEDNEELWQITDNFGYDHPALAAEQICFIPQK
jgi:LysM repeat protein